MGCHKAVETGKRQPAQRWRDVVEAQTNTLMSSETPRTTPPSAIQMSLRTTLNTRSDGKM